MIVTNKFVGYNLDSPCYRVHLPYKRDVISSVNVIFDEETENTRKIEVSFDIKYEDVGRDFNESESERSNYEGLEDEPKLFDSLKSQSEVICEGILVIYQMKKIQFVKVYVIVVP